MWSARTSLLSILCALAVFVLFNVGFASTLTWPGGKQIALSFSVDDGYCSELALEDALRRKGWRGTFYLAASLVEHPDQSCVSDWQYRFGLGNEIGNHTYNHLDARYAPDWRTIAAEVGAMEQWLVTNIYRAHPSRSWNHTFAYPFAVQTIGYQAPGVPPLSFQETVVGTCEYAALLSVAVTGARGVGSTTWNASSDVYRNRFNLNAHEPADLKEAKRVIDDAISLATGGETPWVILVFHQPVAWHYDFIDWLYQNRANNIWVEPVINVLEYILDNTPYAPWSCEP